jgi:hypothetical protein
MHRGLSFIKQWSQAVCAASIVYAVLVALGPTIAAAAEPIILDCGDELFFKVNYETSTIAQRNPDGTWMPEQPVKVTSVTITWQTKPDGDFPGVETMIDRQTGRRTWHETSGGKSGTSTCRLSSLAPKF